MNPFTRFLSQFSRRRNTALDAFIARWDTLERLVIRVYKEDAVTAEDQRLFDENWPWLLQNYTIWQAALASYWPTTLVGGVPAPQDPFLRLLRVVGPEAFRNDWEAMQYLPAAREALNQMLVAGSRS